MFEEAKMMQNRRALSSINGNIIGAPSVCSLAVCKRCSQQTNVAHDKQLLHPVQRPVPRKIAAPAANNLQQLPSPEETKEPAQVLPDLNDSDDNTDIDLEDYETMASDFSAPMFVQHTEAILDEVDRMDEIEMEDACEVPIVDIDAYDKKDPLAVTEYIDDLYRYYKKVEDSGCAPSNYMKQQPDINERMRAMLIDWLIKVHYKFQLMDETLYLSVNLIDRFLSVQLLGMEKLQLAGITAMLLACKYEEVFVPVVEDFVLISDRAYNRKEVLAMERLMVTKLQFKMSVPTPYVFMRRFLKMAQSDKKFEFLSFFMMELCLVEYEMLKFPPSLLAASAIYAAQCTLSRLRSWSRTYEYYTGYTEEQLLECSKRMVVFHQSTGTGMLKGVHQKYSMPKFDCAAKAEPASFLLSASL